jgi:hypothetical protein
MSEQQLGSPVATYVYRDRQGWPLYRVDRFEPKTFRVHHAATHDSGGTLWKPGLGKTERVLYRLPELAAAPRGARVYVCEGEKDADALASLGLIATTNFGGAGNWNNDDSQQLLEFDVVILPDNDDPGRTFALDLVDQIGSCTPTRIVELPGLPPKGDVSDWLAAGGTVAELERLVAQTPQAEIRPPIPTGPRLITRKLSDVAPEQVTWLWEGWLPRGKLSLLGGHPGDGKSTLTTALAATLSTGGAWPDGSQAPLGSTLFLLAEDALGDTVRPRLDQHGADVERIEAVEMIRHEDGREQIFSLSEHLEMLEERIMEMGAALLVIDPLSDFLTSRNRNDDGDIRDVLTPLGKLAERCNVAILGIMHIGKPGAVRKRPLQTFMGSTAFGAVARQALLVHPIPEGERKLLAVIKSNVAVFPRPLEWSRPLDSAIIWHGQSQHSVEVLLDGGGVDAAPTQREIAGQFLKQVLVDGPMPSRIVRETASERGISETTLNRECQSLGITYRKVGGSRESPWYMGLPETDWVAFTRSEQHQDDPDARLLGQDPCDYLDQLIREYDEEEALVMEGLQQGDVIPYE